MRPAHDLTVIPSANRYVRTRPLRQEGAISIMTAALLVLILGFFGLAIDLSMLYNRKVEMQNVADSIALAAAAELNGTESGITKAVAQATARFAGSPPTGLAYQYGTLPMSDWSDDAMTFSSSPSAPDAEWHTVAYAKANAADMLYVKVDTSRLDIAYSTVTSTFIRAVSQSATVPGITARAIAGRSSIKITPLAICALRPAPADRARNRSGELVEYGFRRGVGYDLMNLNPESSSLPAKTFLINPWAPPGVAGSSPKLNLANVKPFVCSGTMAMPRVTGGALTVDATFPIADLVTDLNSRFDSADSTCNAYTAPPDSNIKPYTVIPANTNTTWMKVAPGRQTAAESLTENKRWTVADPEPSPGGTLTADFGLLWSYAKAAKHASYVSGSPEPTNGYTTFSASATDWTALYSPGTPEPNAYPASTPYLTQVLSPTSGRKGVRGRRVLNIPLLSCSAGAGATVLGVGKFFMTVPATTTTLSAEFAGTVPELSLGGPVELYP